MTAVGAVDASREPAFGARHVMKAFRRPSRGRDDEILVDVDLQLAIRALDALIGGLSRLGHVLVPCAVPRPDRILCETGAQSERHLRLKNDPIV